MSQLSTPFILFITGASTSGKTTVYQSLKKDDTLAHYDFHDIDEEGVPDFGRSPWRAFRVEALLGTAIERLHAGRSSIICGITMPHEVIESVQYDSRLNIHFLLLDISYETFKERIIPRLNKQKHLKTEVSDDGGKEALFASNRSLIRILRHSTQNQMKGHLIEAGAITEEAMITDVRKLIAAISHGSQTTKQ